MAEVDFTRALGRLLRDGSLRDAFAADPITVARQFSVSDADLRVLVSLPPADLEYQATVLLRKRYDLIRRLLPVTCARLSEAAWPVFREYARSHWPQSAPAELSDARAFCDYLSRTGNPHAPCRSEANRIVFAESDRLFGLYFVPDLPGRRGAHCGIQLLLRYRKHGWRELTIYLSL
ncbi:MAG TPA: hypothetical protein VIS96_00905 [Terrimicrobiaceae bacterium]